MNPLIGPLLGPLIGLGALGALGALLIRMVLDVRAGSR